MPLLRSILTSFVPSMKAVGVKTYRQLARETGTYAGMIEGYRPYLGDHEPPDRTARAQRARIVYELILAAEAERIAEVTALLARQGLAVTPAPEAWDAIGRWVLKHIEGSREPGSDRYAPYIRDRVGDPPPKQVDGESTTKVRPLWRSVAFDLSLLLGRHMIEALPGGRWIRDGEQRGREGSVLAAPLVAHDGKPAVHQPFANVSGFMRHALAVRLRVVSEVGSRLGDGLRWVTEAAETDFKLPSAEESFINAVREMAEEYGTPPDPADLELMLKEHGLTEMPALPPDLARMVRRNPT
ncbi:hypothetical protein [Neorhizobium sp. DT-125]|uniref:hypothetical protein n=1 Tax=Neorhizobium sp. DT-125 TaxID=3396163 RepID=UPI003F19DFDD